MPRLTVSNTQWKILIGALGMILFASFTVAAINWEQFVIPEKAGVIDMQVGPSLPGPTFPVIAVPPESSAAAQGVKVGDVIRYDRLSDTTSSSGYEQHRFGINDQVGITVSSQGQSRHVFIHPRPVQTIDKYDVFTYFFDMVIALSAIIFSVVIGIRKPESFSARMLSLILLAFSSGVIENMLPIGQIKNTFYLLVSPFSFFFTFGGYLVFAMYFPNDHGSNQPPLLRRIVPIALVFEFLLDLCVSLWRIGHLPYIMVQILRPLGAGPTVTLIVLSFIVIYFSYKNTTGEARQRVRWMILATVPIYLDPVLNFFVDFIYPSIKGSPEVNLVSSILPLISMLGLAYAVLRVRIFDFGFVINRALVYGVVSLLLLTSFGLVEWLVEHLIHFEEREKNVLLDGAIALAIYLSFHRVRHAVEHYIEQIFFHKWHSNEETLRHFVRQAAYISASDALLRDFLAELKRFSGGAECALYLPDSNGNYRATTIDSPGVVELIDANDNIAVALRAGLVPIQNEGQHPGLANNLALPMSHRGQINGFALIGPKPNGEIFRPDEMEVLGFAAHQIGLDLFALQNEKLKSDVARMNKEKEILQIKLDDSHRALETFATKMGDRSDRLRTE